MFLSKFDQDHMSADALAAFAALEQAYGKPFTVNSAHRDPAKNAAVGGAKKSEHMNGNAFDINVADLPKDERIALINLAREVGFGGVGVYDNSLHFDTGPTRYWGPDYSSGSLPDWAAGAVGAARGSASVGPKTAEAPVNALAAPQQQDQSSNALLSLLSQPTNRLDPQAFMNRYSPAGLNALGGRYNGNA